MSGEHFAKGVPANGNGNGNGNVRVPDWVWRLVPVVLTVLLAGAPFIFWLGSNSQAIAGNTQAIVEMREQQRADRDEVRADLKDIKGSLRAVELDVASLVAKSKGAKP